MLKLIKVFNKKINFTFYFIYFDGSCIRVFKKDYFSVKSLCAFN